MNTIADVPYCSQVGNQYRNNCGPACVLMVYNHYRQQHGQTPAPLTVDHVRALSTPAERRHNTSTTADLVAMANQINFLYKDNFKLQSTNGADIRLTPGRIRTEIDAGRPVIQLLLYRHLIERNEVLYRGGHFVVVVGYDDSRYMIHDPYWPDLEGAYWRVPANQFERAIAPEQNMFFSVPYQGCVIVS